MVLRLAGVPNPLPREHATGCFPKTISHTESNRIEWGAGLGDVTRAIFVGNFPIWANKTPRFQNESRVSAI